MDNINLSEKEYLDNALSKKNIASLLVKRVRFKVVGHTPFSFGFLQLNILETIIIGQIGF